MHWFNIFISLPLALAAPLESPENSSTAMLKYIVVMKPLEEAFLDSLLQTTEILSGIVLEDRYDFGSFQGFASVLNEDQRRALEEHDSVDYVEMDGYLHTQERISQQTLKMQGNATWGPARISHRQYTNASTTYLYDTSAGAAACAYILDTGIYTAHPDFEGRALMVKNYDRVDPSSDDYYGHGTHVAGIIGSKTFGVAKKVQLLGMKVCNSMGRCLLSDIISAIGLTISDSTTRNCGKGVVINMSLGNSNTAWQSIDAILKSAVDAGIFVAVSAGNDRLNAYQQSPASSPSTCAVGSMNVYDEMSYFSNWGPKVAVFAPGEDILSTAIPSHNYTELRSGTSMASPHVAGLAAYFMALDGPYTPVALCEKIMDSSTKGAISAISAGMTGTVNRLAFNMAT